MKELLMNCDDCIFNHKTCGLPFCTDKSHEYPTEKHDCGDFVDCDDCKKFDSELKKIGINIK